MLAYATNILTKYSTLFIECKHPEQLKEFAIFLFLFPSLSWKQRWTLSNQQKWLSLHVLNWIFSTKKRGNGIELRCTNNHYFFGGCRNCFFIWNYGKITAGRMCVNKTKTCLAFWNRHGILSSVFVKHSIMSPTISFLM